MISFESFQDLEKPFVFLISVTMYLNLCNIFHTLITVDILHHTKKMTDICSFPIIVSNISIKVKFYLKDLMWINMFVCDIFICFF